VGSGTTEVGCFGHSEIRKYGITNLCNVYALEPGELI